MKSLPSAGTVHSALEHTPDCDWRLDQYPHECNCGARERIEARKAEASKQESDQ